MLNSICGSKPKSILDIAEEAIKEKNYEDLSKVVEVLCEGVRNKRYLVEPLMLIAERLSGNPKFLSHVISAYREAARFAPRGSALEEQAVAGFVKHADAIPDVSERVAAYRDAACHAVTGSALEKQAKAGFLKYANAIPNISERVTANIFAVDQGFHEYGELRQREFAKILEQAEAIPNVLERVTAYRGAARCRDRLFKDISYMVKQRFVGARLDERDEQAVANYWVLMERVVVGILKYAEAIPDVSERVAAYCDAALCAGHRLDVGKKAVSGILKYAEAIPDVSERVAAYRVTANVTFSYSKESKKAVAGILKYADDIPDVSKRVGTYHDAANNAAREATSGTQEQSAVTDSEQVSTTRLQMIPSEKEARSFMQKMASWCPTNG